jgi:hypothetical protein
MRPRAVSVQPLSDYRLLVSFTNGESRVFDVKPYMEFKPFDVLKDRALFVDVRVAGLSIEWATGQDICPDELYFDSIPLEPVRIAH